MFHPGMVALFVLMWTAIVTALPVRAAEENGKTDVVLIKQLGSPGFHEREIAMRDLDAMGAAALPALQRASRGDDLEVCRRAQELIEKIEKRLLTARLLEPQRLQLSYKGTPIDQARLDFSKKTGIQLKIEGDMENGGLSSRQLKRTLTLDSGKVTFWEAFDQFCDKAGLAERSLLPKKLPHVAAESAKNLEKEELALMLLRQRERQLLDLDQAGSAGLFNPFVLAEGKVPRLPTFFSGAARIRALPAPFSVLGPAPSKDEHNVALELTPEPKLKVKRLLEARVSRAIDDQGQSLTPIWEIPSMAGDDELGDVITLVGDATGADLLARSLHQVSVRLKVGPRPSKLIQEMQGTIAAQIVPPPEPLVTVDNVLNAVGQTFTGPDGRTLSVLKAGRDANGRIQLDVEMKHPIAQMNGRFGVAGRRVFRVGRGRIVDSSSSAVTSKYELFDSNGALLKPQETSTGNVIRGAEWTQTWSFTFTPVANDQNLKLVFTGQRTVTLEIPFSLKDIPVP
jgi:hypothetical protein